jgi:hypothetical protein
MRLRWFTRGELLEFRDKISAATAKFPDDPDTLLDEALWSEQWKELEEDATATGMEVFMDEFKFTY